VTPEQAQHIAAEICRHFDRQGHFFDRVETDRLAAALLPLGQQSANIATRQYLGTKPAFADYSPNKIVDAARTIAAERAGRPSHTRCDCTDGTVAGVYIPHPQRSGRLDIWTQAPPRRAMLACDRCDRGYERSKSAVFADASILIGNNGTGEFRPYADLTRGVIQEVQDRLERLTRQAEQAA
jgi:hypothetical protein